MLYCICRVLAIDDQMLIVPHMKKIWDCFALPWLLSGHFVLQLEALICLVV